MTFEDLRKCCIGLYGLSAQKGILLLKHLKSVRRNVASDTAVTDSDTAVLAFTMSAAVFSVPWLVYRDTLGPLFLGQESGNWMTFVKRIISVQNDRLVPPARFAGSDAAGWQLA